MGAVVAFEWGEKSLAGFPAGDGWVEASEGSRRGEREPELSEFDLAWTPGDIRRLWVGGAASGMGGEGWLKWFAWAMTSLRLRRWVIECE